MGKAMRVLIVEDQLSVAERLVEAFEGGDYEVKIASTLKGAEYLLGTYWPEFVVLDANFPTSDVQGDPEFNADSLLTALARSKRIPQPKVILVSGENASAGHFTSIRDWLRTDRISDVLPKSGAWEFFQVLLRHKVEMLRHLQSRSDSDDESDDQEWLRANGIVSRESSMLKAGRQIRDFVARTNNQWTILITGPTGSGKDLIARAIHNAMGIKRGASIPYIVRNCQVEPGIAHTLLFGSRKGAYTSAENIEGDLERAKNGVLFLDDVHLLPRSVQGALLIALENRQFQRLGDDKMKTLEARVVVTTNADLEGLLEKGEMSEEFLTRIDRLRLIVPPLAQRPLDIEPLVRHFVTRMCEDGDHIARDFDGDVIQAFKSYTWPGNIRQLQNIVARVCVESRQRTITLAELRRLGLTYAGRQIEWEASPATATSCEEDGLLTVVGWRGGWRGIGPDMADSVKDWIRLVANGDEVGPTIEAIGRKLDTRRSQSPKAIHYFKAWLFLILSNGSPVTHQRLMNVLDLEWDFTNRIACFLSGVEHTEAGAGFTPAVADRKQAGVRWIYSAKEGIQARTATR